MDTNQTMKNIAQRIHRAIWQYESQALKVIGHSMTISVQKFGELLFFPMRTHRAVLVSIITAMTLIISGCGGEKVDAALLEKCDLLRANLEKLTYTPTFAKVDDPSDTFNYLSVSVSGYIAGNLGMETRANARKLILDKHPYLADYLNNATGNEYSLDNAIRLTMLEKAIEGTGLTLSSLMHRRRT